MTPCQNVRLPTVAGRFYPANAEELRPLVARCLAGPLGETRSAPKAYILPHAGYVYSGPVAGVGYRALRGEADTVDRIILLGPSHFVGFRGLACSRHDGFLTPLGEVPVDRAAVEALLDRSLVIELDQAHQNEHSLEVHLPFLQMTLPHFSIVPIVVGDAPASAVAAVLERFVEVPGTRIVISSDLSHFHDHATACARDRATADRIERLEPVTTEDACGAVGVNGLLFLAARRGWSALTLDLRNSGDTAGPRDRVVGYGAFVLSPKDQERVQRKGQKAQRRRDVS